MNPDRNPRLDPKPGDVWRIAGTEGIIRKITPDTVFAGLVHFHAGRWHEGGVVEIGAAALWEFKIPRFRFMELIKEGQLLQRAE